MEYFSFFFHNIQYQNNVQFQLVPHCILLQLYFVTFIINVKSIQRWWQTSTSYWQNEKHKNIDMKRKQSKDSLLYCSLLKCLYFCISALKPFVWAEQMAGYKNESEEEKEKDRLKPLSTKLIKTNCMENEKLFSFNRNTYLRMQYIHTSIHTYVEYIAVKWKIDKMKN